MLVDGVDYKINIVILLMENEIDVTVQTVETLMESVEDGVVISVLLNGGSNPELKKLLSTVDCIRYYESPSNLGVAGGRNFLLKTAECKGSDIVMILDNDVVPPVDYVRNLATFLIRQKDAGVVGGIVADIDTSITYRAVRHFGDRGRFDNKIFRITSKEIKQYLTPNLTPWCLFHIGIDPDFKFAYFSACPNFYRIVNPFLALFRISKRSNPVLKWNTKYLQLILNGADKYVVSNVAGCSQAFRRKLVDEIGYLNDMFNPYGFEDVDFCIRSTKAGYKNYIDTNTCLYHGTDTRHKEKNPNKALENQFRCLTILASGTVYDPLRYKHVMLKTIIVSFLFDLLIRPHQAFKRVKAKVRGFKTGVRTVEDNVRKTQELHTSC